MKQFAHRMPDVEFWVEVRKESAADKIYLGLFLAICLLVSVLFGNLLFILIVGILSFGIMMAYSTFGDRERCVIGKDGIEFERNFYVWKNLRDFAIVENSMDGGRQYIRLAFQNYLNPHTYIPLPSNVQKETIYAIMSAHLEENPEPRLSIVEMSMLKFFKW
jgi:hypothetical protein